MTIIATKYTKLLEPFEKDGEGTSPQVIVYLSSSPFLLKGFLFKKNIMESRGLRFRVYYGYAPSDYIAIPENELERAEYAWRKNAIFSYGGKQVKGSEFKRIEEDYRYYTGWFDSYSPKDGEDFQQIEKEMPKRSLFQDRINAI